MFHGCQEKGEKETKNGNRIPIGYVPEVLLCVIIYNFIFLPVYIIPTDVVIDRVLPWCNI